MCNEINANIHFFDKNAPK